MKTPKTFLGEWRITETEMWDRSALDEFAPTHITFDDDRLGSFQMIAVQAELDCRFVGSRVEFSWLGDDDGEPANGRGWAEREKGGILVGRIYFHNGDDSSFAAKRM